MRFANAPLTNPAIGSAAARRLPAAAAARALGRPAPAAAVAGTATAALAAARRPRAARGRPAAAPRRRTLSLALEALRARALAVLVLVLVLVAILVLAGLVLEVLDLAVVALLVIGVVVLVDELAVLDHAAPGARLELLHLDERLEAMQVGTHRALDVPHPAGGLLDQRAGVHVHVQLDPRQTRRQLVERHDARVRDALGHLPLDPLVRALRLDVGLEFLLLAPDLGRERDGAVVLLRDPRDPVHELRPVLELGPLVVGRLDRHGHVHGLLHRHPPASSTFSLTPSFSFPPTWSPIFLAALVVAFRATFPGLGEGRLIPLPRTASKPFLASGARAAMPAPAATPRAPESGLGFFWVWGLPPTFLTASLTTCPSASRTVSLMSLAIRVSPKSRACVYVLTCRLPILSGEKRGGRSPRGGCKACV